MTAHRRRTTIELPDDAAPALRSLAATLGYANPKHGEGGGSLSGLLAALARAYSVDPPGLAADLAPRLHAAVPHSAPLSQPRK